MELSGKFGEGAGGPASLFGVRPIGLCHFRDAFDSQHNIAGQLQLQLGRVRDLTDLGGGILGDLADSLERLAGGTDALHFGFHFGPFFRHHRDGFLGLELNGLDQASHFAGGLGRLLGQFSDFLGDDRETSTVFARPHRLDRGVQGQHVGPRRNGTDRFDDRSDLLRVIAQGAEARFTRFDVGPDAVHTLNQLSYHFQSGHGRIASRDGCLLSGIGVVRHRIDIA